MISPPGYLWLVCKPVTVKRDSALRILIVDDSRAMQSIVRRGILAAGYSDLDIRTASDGVEALDIIRVWEPELVLSDWHMPNMNGLELLAALRREAFPVKIGFVTTEHEPERVKIALDAGAQFVVSKPFTNEELLKAVMPVLLDFEIGEVSAAIGDVRGGADKPAE